MERCRVGGVEKNGDWWRGVEMNEVELGRDKWTEWSRIECCWQEQSECGVEWRSVELSREK